MAPRMPSFKNIRRRSLASFRTGSGDSSTSNEDPSSQAATPSTGSITPPSMAGQSDPALAAQPNQPPGLRSNRNSYISVGQASPSSEATERPPSVYSPRITNVQHNERVYQKLVLINGVIGDGPQNVDGNVTIYRKDRQLPPIDWPVHGGRFKAMISLFHGQNHLRFEYRRSGLPHTLDMTIIMIEYTNVQPLQLVILLAKDSPCTYDAIPARAEREGNDLEMAMRKFRMSAYMWQAYTADQMYRNGLGRRAWRFEDEWTRGSVNASDWHEGTMRSETRVHFVTTDKTVAEIRDIELAQQNTKATRKNELFNIAADAITKHFNILPGQKMHVAALIMDAHWDPAQKLITGHAALGGRVNDGLHLAIFGSHCLQSYPASLEQVAPAMVDCTPTETTFVANDCNEAGSSWEAATLGIGAHLHEVGHLLGLPHQASGIMARDYTMLNRSFVVKEAFCTRTKTKGSIKDESDEPTWHRLDLLRFRHHALFKFPGEFQGNGDGTVHGWTVENKKVIVTAGSGLLCTEIFAAGEEHCLNWIEYTKDAEIQRSVMYSETELRAYLPANKRKLPFRIIVRSRGGGELVIKDFPALCKSSVKLSSSRSAYRSTMLGNSEMKGSQAQEFVFSSALTKNGILTSVVVYHGRAVDGLEFFYHDGSSQLFGKRGGKPGGDKFTMDLNMAEVITGFGVRAGLWIDAIQILTSTARTSPWYGNIHGGSANRLSAPKGYRICGVSGSCADWIDGFSLLITRV
ncbi:putative peptidase family-domain-containing protein [Xylariaceae sp. FL1019]|nr:putative peptidase family-domain-containing protein [Xylariaceae sp. FL1019]